MKQQVFEYHDDSILVFSLGIFLPAVIGKLDRSVIVGAFLNVSSLLLVLT